MPLLPVVISFDLNESIVALSAVKSTILSLASQADLSLQYCHKIPDIFE